MTDFEPIITANLYSIHFVPVAVQLNGSKRWEMVTYIHIRRSVCQVIMLIIIMSYFNGYRLAIAEGYFVVELTLLESPCRQIYTISEKDSNGELYDR